MNYERIYNEIIANRVNKTPDGYTEKHHIIPRSLGGLDDQSNLVALTAREHFLCHWLLVKIHRLDIGNHAKMLCAFTMMCFAISDLQQRVNNSRRFEKYRIEFAKMMTRNNIGDKNPQYGTIWITDIANKISTRITKGEVPEGWVLGRNKWKQYFANCIQCKTEFAKNDQSKFCSNSCKTIHIAAIPKLDKRYKNGFKVSVNNIEYDTISHAADSLGIGHETARMRFKSNSFPEYVIFSR